MNRKKVSKWTFFYSTLSMVVLAASALMVDLEVPVFAKQSDSQDSGSQKSSKHSKSKKPSKQSQSDSSCFEKIKSEGGNGKSDCENGKSDCKSGKSCDKNDGTDCGKEDRKAMKITLTKSGGIMGMNRVYDVDSTKLTDEQAKKLSQLIDSSKILDLKSKTTAGAADLFYYEFKIDDGKDTTQLHFDDLSLPESVRPLLSFLLEASPGVNQR